MNDNAKVLKREAQRGVKAEWVKRTGTPWPKGMTMKELSKILTRAHQENEAKKAFHKVMAKASGMLPSEIQKANNDPDWSFFWGISAAVNRDLKIEWVKKRLQKAIEQNDLEFFIRFGHELKRKPRVTVIDKVSSTLAFFWTTYAGKGIPPLSCFTDEALTEMLKILTKNESLSLDQVRKARQRLKLEIKDIQIKGVERVDKDFFRLIWVDKAQK
jgi:hypothetical protein